MTLSELIIEYRERNSLSQRQFAIKCNLSNGYISMLERGVNPATNRKIKPTLDQLKKLANGMNMSVMELMTIIDDMPIDMSDASSSEDNERVDEFVRLFRQLTPEQQALIIAQIKGILSVQE